MVRKPVMLALIFTFAISVIGFSQPLKIATKTPEGLRVLEPADASGKLPSFVSNLADGRLSLKWKRLEDELLPGMFLGVYRVFRYQANLNNGTIVQTEFCEAGRASVQKLVGGLFVSEEKIFPLPADTYVLKVIRNGEIESSWVHKEFGDYGKLVGLHKKYAIVGEYLPIIKKVYEQSQNNTN